MCPATSIAVVVDGPDPDQNLQASARQLAAELTLPLIGAGEQSQYDLLLAVTQAGLELGEPGGPTIRADFATGRLRRRADSPGQGAAMLRRAVGFKRPPWRVLDLTAGLGRDAFLLATAGCEVTAVERSPIIAALTADGLARAAASADAELAGAIGRLHLIVGDSRQWLAAGRFDAVYLDPMFPQRSKSALVKKEMRICRLAAGEDTDGAGLLADAVRLAGCRVAVKRPRLAPPLGADPSFVLPGKTIRYDVYVPR